MKFRFNNEEYVLGGWKKFGYSYQRTLRSVKPIIEWNQKIDCICLRLCNKYGEPFRYKAYGEGYMSEVIYFFNKTYNHPTFTEKQIEKTKMDLTNFIIKYNKLYTFT